MDINFDIYTLEEIDNMIASGICTEQDVIDFYNNEFWRDRP